MKSKKLFGDKATLFCPVIKIAYFWAHTSFIHSFGSVGCDFSRVQRSYPTILRILFNGNRKDREKITNFYFYLFIKSFSHSTRRQYRWRTKNSLISYVSMSNNVILCKFAFRRHPIISTANETERTRMKNIVEHRVTYSKHIHAHAILCVRVIRNDDVRG